MWTRSLEERYTTGKDVRRLIADNETWEHLLPKSVSRYIKNNKLDLRIKELKNGDN